MKKTKIVYVKPEMDVMEIVGENMFATSGHMGVGGENPNPEEDPGANSHRGSWGNLWD